VQNFKIVLTILVALLLQLVLPKRLLFFQYIDLALVVTVYFSLQREPVRSMFTGAFAGLGGDAVSGGVLGVGGFIKTLIGYLISVISIKFPLENLLARLAIVGAASVANTFLFVGLNLMLEQDLPYISNWGEFGKTLGWKALADTATSIVLFFVLDRVFPEKPAASRMVIKKRFYE